MYRDDVGYSMKKEVIWRMKAIRINLIEAAFAEPTSFSIVA